MLRVENALVSYVKYLLKLLWPVDLGVLYPLPQSYPLWQVIGSVLALLSISLLVIRGSHTRRYLVVGWFWFLVTLLPVIGLIQVGSQSMADRYTYLPGIGLFIMVAWGIPDLSRNWPLRNGILALLSVVILTVSTVLTRQQISYWQDSITIFRHTLRVTPDNYLVNDLIGVTLAKKGNLDAAINEFQVALRINPNDSAVRRNLGVTLAQKGYLAAAIEEYHASLRISPGDIRTQDLLATTLLEKGDLEAAIQQCQATLRVAPQDTTAQETLRNALEKQGSNAGTGK